jgi:hypothetical protein
MWSTLRTCGIVGLFVIVALACTFGAASAALVRPRVERIDIQTASLLRADYSADPRGHTQPPLLPAVIPAAASDERAAATATVTSMTPDHPQAEPPASQAEGSATPGPSKTATPKSAATPTPRASATSRPTPAATPTPQDAPPSPTSTRAAPTATPAPKPTETPRPNEVATPSTVKKTPTPTNSPEPTKTPAPSDNQHTPETEPTATRTPAPTPTPCPIDLLGLICL